MPLHKFRDIKLWLLQDLDLADEAVLDREDGRGCLSNVVANRSGDEFLDKTLEVSFGTEFRHDGGHFGANGTDFGTLGVASGFDLIVLRTCESNAKHSDNVSVGSSAVNIGLDDRLLLANQGAKLVSGHVHSVEIQETVVSLNVFNTQLDFSERHALVLVQVGKRNFNDTSLEVVRSNLGTLSLGNQSLSTVLGSKDRRSNEFVPFLLQKGVDRLFAASLLGFRQSLVLALQSSN